MAKISSEILEEAGFLVSDAFMDAMNFVDQSEGRWNLSEERALVEFVTSYAAIYIETVAMLSTESTADEPWE